MAQASGVNVRLIVLWWDVSLMPAPYALSMSFVRKPRPYSSGLPGTPPLPSAAPAPARRVRPARPPRAPRPPLPRAGWPGAVTALAALGAVLVLLVGLSGLWNSVARDWQFRSAAAGVTDVVR